MEAEEAAENVRVRCEVLGVEEERLLGELSELDSRLADQRQQVAGIETQQSNIEQQINQLTHTYVHTAFQIKTNNVASLGLAGLKPSPFNKRLLSPKLSLWKKTLKCVD